MGNLVILVTTFFSEKIWLHYLEHNSGNPYNAVTKTPFHFLCSLHSIEVDIAKLL